GRADRVRGEHTAGRVDRKRSGELGLAALDHLPALTGPRDVVPFEPHRLVPAERHVQLGDVDLLARHADTGLTVDILRALDTGLRTHGIPAREDTELAPYGRRFHPRRWLRSMPATRFVGEH